MLTDDGRFEVCADIGDAARAVAAAVRECPDVCVLDIKLPGGGLSAAWEITARLPRVKLVMLTLSDEGGDLFPALRAGAEGYLLKTGEFTRLPSVLASVCAGEAVVEPAFVGKLLRHFRAREPRWRKPAVLAAEHPVPPGHRSALPESHLTSREWEVLELLSEGLPTAGIASSMMISSSAVRVHIAAVVRKLGVPDRAAAVETLQRTEQGRSDN